MNTKKRTKTKQPSQKEIDKIVESQAEDESEWEQPIQVRRRKHASLAISGELAARAAFLARLHREKSVEDWLSRIIRERVELEETAFSRAKRELSSTNGA